MRCETGKLHNFNKGLALFGGSKRKSPRYSCKIGSNDISSPNHKFNPMVILVFLLLVLLIGGNRMLQQA
jgi:hypothetical protein